MIVSNMQICPRCHATIQPEWCMVTTNVKSANQISDDCCSGEICQPSIEMSTLKEEENIILKNNS